MPGLTGFQPDYNYILDVMHNRKPKRLCLYEHLIDIPFISKLLGRDIAIQSTKPVDMEAHYSDVAGSWPWQ